MTFLSNKLSSFDLVNGITFVPTWICGRYALTGTAINSLLDKWMLKTWSEIENSPERNITVEDVQRSHMELDIMEDPPYLRWQLWVKSSAVGLQMEEVRIRLPALRPYMESWCTSIQVGCTFEPGSFHELRWMLPAPARFLPEVLPTSDEVYEMWEKFKADGVDLNFYNTLPRWETQL